MRDKKSKENPNNLHHLFEYFFEKVLKNQSVNLNEKKSIFYQQKVLSFQDLYNNVIILNKFLYEKLANISIKDESVKSTVIGVYLKHDEFTIPLIMAIHSLSLCYLPIDPNLPQERIKYILKDAKPLLIISNIEDGPIDETIEYVNLKDAFNTHKQCDWTLKRIKDYDSSDLACVLYTSGSTGLPKGDFSVFESNIVRSI